MNWIDIVVLVVWAVTALSGFLFGMAHMLVTLVVVGGGLALSSRLTGPLGDVFSRFTDDTDVLSVATFLAILGAAIIVAALANYALGKLGRFKEAMGSLGPVLGLFNRLSGLALGVLVGYVLVTGAVTGAQRFPIGDVEEDLDDSALGAFLADSFDVVVRSIRLIPDNWDQELDTRNRDALAHPPRLYRPPSSPSTLRHIAEYYSPVIFQDTASSLAKADYLASWNYDGDLDPTNNWNNLLQGDADLHGRVSYWVLETETHWYVGYGFFHPRDWGVSLGTIEVAECTSDSQATQSICHENDMEGVLITIQKLTDRPYGAFLTMETISHSDILSFKDYDTSPSREVSGHFHLCSLLACDVQFLEGTGHPFVYIESRSHAVYGDEGWERNFPGGDGVVYFPTGVAEMPGGGDDRVVGYSLVDIDALWGLRGEDTVFTNEPDGVGGYFLGNEGSRNAASPPWRWSDGELSEAGPGVLFLDPARWIDSTHNGLARWPAEYIGRSYSSGPDDGFPTLTARFDWSMPDRIGEDTDMDGLIDYLTTQEAVNPPGWQVDFDSCGSAAGASPISQYIWTIEDTQRSTETLCDGFSHRFPREGAYRVMLTVVAHDGLTASHTQEVVVQDWLIVSLGDSYASGEGVPDVPIVYDTGYWVSVCSLDQYGAVPGFLVDGECYSVPPIGGAPGIKGGASMVEGCFSDQSGTVPGIAVPLGASRESGATCFGFRIPDSPPMARWQDERCRRSANAGPAQAAIRLEKADPRTSVTFVHLACAGSTTSGLPGQIRSANELIGERKIDALLLSIGGNDAGFANIVYRCMNQEPCYDDRFILVVDDTVCEFARPIDQVEQCADFVARFGGSPDAPSAQRTFFDSIYNHGCSAEGPGCRRLLERFATFKEEELIKLKGLNYPGAEMQRQDRVYISEYPDLTRDDTGNYCRANPLSVLPGWSDSEIVWADTVVATQLNDAVAKASDEAGWNLIGDIYSGFRSHGICAEDHWIVRLYEAFIVEGHPNGTLHPNQLGHAFYAQRVFEELMADLYENGDLRLPRRPD